jgi:hypothetical protein
MHRTSSYRASSFVGASLVAAPMLAACLTNELVNVGSNFDASEPIADSGAAPGASADAGGDAGADPTDAQRAPPIDSPFDAETGLAPVVRELCVPNGSFEILPDNEAGTATPSPVLSAPTDWVACNGSNSANASSCSLEPTNGSSCLGLTVGFPFVIPPASVDVVPCAAIEPGASYSLTVDVALDAPAADGGQMGEPPVLQLRGSNTSCDPQGDLLWRFSGLSNSCGWKTLCGTMTPTRSYSHLLLVPETSSSTALAFLQTNLLVDNLRPVDGCPSR